MSDQKPHAIIVDCKQKVETITPIWRSFGYDEINWTYTPRGKRIYKEIAKLSDKPYYIRFHHAFTSGNGLSTPTKGSGDVYHENENGEPVYNFSYLDQVIETIIENNSKPIFELGFMPDALSRKKKQKPIYFYSDNDAFKYPPRDYRKWEELVYQTVKHYVEKYGAEEVKQWYWELWNEPDAPIFFKGSVKDYCKLYDHTVAGAVRALPEIKIGGPGLAGKPKFLEKFLAHCYRGKNHVTGKRGTLLRFISFHAKGTSWPLKGEPFKMPSLKAIFWYLENFEHVLAKYPHFQTLPCLLDECDMAVATNYGMYDFPEYEFHNNEYYPVFFIRMIKNILDFVSRTKIPIQLATSWAFYFEGKRFFEGNRALFTNENIRNPIFNAFVMLEKIGGVRVQLEKNNSGKNLSDDFPEVDGFAAINDDQSLGVIVWNFDESNASPVNRQIDLQIKSIPFSSGKILLRKYQIDSQNSNPYAVWKSLGAPQDPSAEEIEQIKKAQGLALIEEKKIAHEQPLRLQFELPGRSVCLITLQTDELK